MGWRLVGCCVVAVLGCGPSGDTAAVGTSGDSSSGDTTVSAPTTSESSTSNDGTSESSDDSSDASSSDSSGDSSTTSDTPPACRGNVSYVAAPPIDAGYNPQGLHLADTDADGALDLLVALGGQDSVAHFVGDGTGSFAPPTTMLAGYIPGSVATADFDGDGALDFVVGLRDEFDLMLYFGDGEGAFEGPVHLPHGGRAEAVALADVDGDGYTDILATENSLKLHYGGPNGEFGGVIEYATPYDVRDLAVVDFDADGRLDVVTSSWTERQVLLLRGDDALGFGTTETFDADVAVSTVAVADFDEDGVLDVAFAGRTSISGPPYTSAAGVALGDGEGWLLAPTLYEMGASAMTIVATDLDLDTHIDLAVTDLGVLTENEPGRTHVFWGGGDGSFASPVGLVGGTNPSGLDAADLDGDGLLELVVANNGSGDVTVYMATCGDR